MHTAHTKQDLIINNIFNLLFLRLTICGRFSILCVQNCIITFHGLQLPMLWLYHNLIHQPTTGGPRNLHGFHEGLKHILCWGLSPGLPESCSLLTTAGVSTWRLSLAPGHVAPISLGDSFLSAVIISCRETHWIFISNTVCIIFMWGLTRQFWGKYLWPGVCKKPK